MLRVSYFELRDSFRNRSFLICGRYNSGDCQDFCVRRFPSCAHEALFEHDGELRLRLGPLSRRSFPIRSGVVQNQI